MLTPHSRERRRYLSNQLERVDDGEERDRG
jgi:hypothetical protein